MKRHVVLVGLPGSGKTTVGRLAADQLGAPFVDLDDEIERVTGQAVRELFSSRGESRFRELERDVMRSALSARPAVLAPGGGWAAQTGEMANALQSAFIIYLAVPVDVVAQRIAHSAQRTAPARPLLSHGSLRERLSVLLTEREPFYRLADVVISNAADEPGPVARLVAELARRHAGW